MRVSGMILGVGVIGRGWAWQAPMGLEGLGFLRPQWGFSSSGGHLRSVAGFGGVFILAGGGLGAGLTFYGI